MFKKFTKLLKCNSHAHKVLKRNNASSEVIVFINGKEVSVPSYFTIMQALRRERVTIPSFCYHDRLSIAGNCRMCLVHIEGWIKPQVACAVPVAKGMKIRTNSDVTLRAQEGVLEFILADHPLDCPICDQGGECDLQDLTMRFGNDRSRFTDIHFEGKRAVEDKDMGPLIRTCMNRCIHCTRCIRFASQICGLDVLGTTGRGHAMLVGTYVNKMFLSEISGNIIDLCPVGSLTSIPYMFKARPWEVKKVNSIDVTDATGTNIVLNYRFDRVLRVLPREHDEVNQEWVSDKGRWAIDSLDMQRLVSPMAHVGLGLREVDWDYALSIAATMLQNEKDVAAIAGPHSSAETLVACKDLLNLLGHERVYIERNLCHTISGADIRAAYSLNIPMKDIPKADKILLIGTNPRFEAPILNIWIRQAFTVNECDIFVVGPRSDYNYHVTYLGEKTDDIDNALKALSGAKRPLILIGMGMLETEVGSTIIREIDKFVGNYKYEYDWPIVNVVPLDASFAAALEIGYQPNGIQRLNELSPGLVLCLGCDDIFNYWKPPQSTKLIYIGFQGDKGCQLSSLLLPGSAYTEAGGTYMNMENRAQYAMPAVTPPGKARHDWKILRALAEYCGVNMFYSDEATLSCRMNQISPALVALDEYQYNVFGDLLNKLVPFGESHSIIHVPMKSLKEYYCSDVFTYNSPTMIKALRAAADYENRDYARN